MDMTVKKISEREGAERFILVNAGTREVLTANDVSETSVRRFFGKRGVSDTVIDECLQRARLLFQRANSRPEVDESADTVNDDDLLFELGLGEEE